MTHASLEAFMNLISCQMITKVEEVFKIILTTLYYKVTKEAVAELQTPEYTILRKCVDSNCFPFDGYNFSSKGENAINKNAVELQKDLNSFEKQSTPLAYKATYINKRRLKEYFIDLNYS